MKGKLRGVLVGSFERLGIDIYFDANLLPTNSYCSWEIFYSAINNCNIVMKFAPTVLEEDPDFTQPRLATRTLLILLLFI